MISEYPTECRRPSLQRENTAYGRTVLYLFLFHCVYRPKSQSFDDRDRRAAVTEEFDKGPQRLGENKLMVIGRASCDRKLRYGTIIGPEVDQF